MPGQNHTNNAAKKKHRSRKLRVQRLAEENVVFRDDIGVDCLDDCPDALRDLFRLVQDVRNLRTSLFGTKREKEKTVRECYETELKAEADELSTDCRRDRMPSASEEDWVASLKPIVFHRFNQAQDSEVLYRRMRNHYCFTCQKPFALHSRPWVGRMARKETELVEKNIRGLPDLPHNWEACSKHDNLPLFDADKLTYGNEEAEAEGAKIPDLTIGLMASDHRAWDFTDKNSERASGFHTSDDVLELFDFNTIQQLQKRELLEFPYECGKRTNRTSTIFPFALWEAKKADSGCSHQSALAQNCVKVKRILKWQRDVANGSKVPWNPLVWVYISIGAQWSVYGCHIQENDGRVEDQYVLRRLWEGRAADDDGALQLLYIVDLVALWANYIYKTFAEACLCDLKAKMDKRKTPDSYRQTLKVLASRTSVEKLDPQTFPWLSMPRPVRIIRKRDDYTWVSELPGTTSNNDLLVIRIDKHGDVLEPIVLFAKSNWKSTDFLDIVELERQRYPEGIFSEFRQSKDNRRWRQKLFDPAEGLLLRDEVQISIVLSLNPRDARKASKSAFLNLELLLDLGGLVEEIEKENSRWCKCGQPLSETCDPSWICCDNIRCAIQWFHKGCVEGVENTPSTWLCDHCRYEEVRLSTYDNNVGHIREAILDGSDSRIHLLRSVLSAWAAHQWPQPRKVVRKINELSNRIKIRKRHEQHATVSCSNYASGAIPKCQKEILYKVRDPYAESA